MKQRQILTQAKKQDLQVLSEVNHKANRRIQLGAIALKVMLMGAIAAGFSAWQSPKTVIAANSDQAVAEVETARLENEHLLKQSASKQKLSVASQKPAVNGVREQNSLQQNAAVYSVSFSPDGQTIASSSGDNTIKLWKRDGTLITTLKGHNTNVFSVSFSPDGQTLASSSFDNVIKLWKRDGTLITTLTGHNSAVFSVSFSPDGQTLASGSADGTVKLWKLK